MLDRIDMFNQLCVVSKREAPTRVIQLSAYLFRQIKLFLCVIRRFLQTNVMKARLQAYNVGRF